MYIYNILYFRKYLSLISKYKFLQVCNLDSAVGCCRFMAACNGDPWHMDIHMIMHIYTFFFEICVYIYDICQIYSRVIKSCLYSWFVIFALAWVSCWDAVCKNWSLKSLFCTKCGTRVCVKKSTRIRVGPAGSTINWDIWWCITFNKEHCWSGQGCIEHGVNISPLIFVGSWLFRMISICFQYPAWVWTNDTTEAHIF